MVWTGCWTGGNENMGSQRDRRCGRIVSRRFRGCTKHTAKQANNPPHEPSIAVKLKSLLISSHSFTCSNNCSSIAFDAVAGGTMTHSALVQPDKNRRHGLMIVPETGEAPTLETEVVNDLTRKKNANHTHRNKLTLDTAVIVTAARSQRELRNCRTSVSSTASRTRGVHHAMIDDHGHRPVLPACPCTYVHAACAHDRLCVDTPRWRRSQQRKPRCHGPTEPQRDALYTAP